MPCSVSCSEWMRMRHRSSPATFDCLISEIAVTSVSIAEAYSPFAASCTARVMADVDTVLLNRSALQCDNSEEIFHTFTSRGGLLESFVKEKLVRQVLQLTSMQL